MPQFTIEGRMKGMADIHRNWLFEVSIPQIANIVPSVSDEEQFIIRAKTAAIPDRTNTPIESYFKGMKQWFPGRSEFGSTMVVGFEETEDQKILTALYDWQNIIFNIKAEDADAGHSLAPSKRDGQTTDVFIKMQKYDGSDMNNIVRLVNGWPTSVGEAALDMAGNEAVRYECTFQFDYWDLISA